MEEEAGCIRTTRQKSISTRYSFTPSVADKKLSDDSLWCYSHFGTNRNQSSNTMWLAKGYQPFKNLILRQGIHNMKVKFRRTLSVAVFSSAVVVSMSGNSAVARIDESAFMPAAGQITFSEFALGTVNPSYSASAYGGDATSPNVSFGGYFVGESLSTDPSVDCPGAAPTACIMGSPTGPLTIDVDSPDTFISQDSSNPTSPVLSGTPQFNGPIAVLFDSDQSGVGFDSGFFDAAQSTGISAFSRDGTALGTVTNLGTNIEFLGLVTDDGSAQIAGVFLDLVGAEPFGFAIDNLRFGGVGEVIVPPQVPLPAALPLFVGALSALGMAGWRRRSK